MDLISKQIQDDCKTILSTQEGQRFFGSIFHAAKLNLPGRRDEYYQGVRDCALMIANTIREVNPFYLTQCEIAYAELQRRYEEDGRADYDDGTAATD